jgi:hypothetical protein
MDPMTAIILALRLGATVMTLQGKPEVGMAVNATLNAYDAGRNVDAHMAELAAALKAGAGMATWADIAKRANDETLALLDQYPRTV